MLTEETKQRIKDYLNENSYLAHLVSLPKIITKPGKYITRGGETINISKISNKHDFNCIGTYPNGVSEKWHHSGRLYDNVKSDNDIIKVR